MKALIAELMGRTTGICGSRGGSQHICYKDFYTNGIQGGIVSNATGAALAEKLKCSSNIAVVFLGDGTMGEGLVYESFNMASLWNIPVLYVIENNRYAQSTAIETSFAGDMAARPRSFGIKSAEIKSNNVLDLFEVFQDCFDYVRNQQKPFCQIVETYRLGPHSKGDDFREADEIEEHWKSEPLLLIKNSLSESFIAKAKKEIDEALNQSIEAAKKAPFPTLKDIEFDNTDVVNPSYFVREASAGRPCLVVSSLNAGLHRLMDEREDVVFIGEDILDPYGGAFKVPKGLSTKHPKRCFSSSY